MERERILTRLHVTVPNVLLKRIEREGDLHNIDDIVSGLLYKYYNMNPNGADENDRKERNKYRY